MEQLIWSQWCSFVCARVSLVGCLFVPTYDENFLISKKFIRFEKFQNSKCFRTFWTLISWSILLSLSKVAAKLNHGIRWDATILMIILVCTNSHFLAPSHISHTNYYCFKGFLLFFFFFNFIMHLEQFATAWMKIEKLNVNMNLSWTCTKTEQINTLI